MEYKGIHFEYMQEVDIDNLTLIMKRAFDKDSQEFLGIESGGPEGYDNGEFLRKYGLDKRSTAYKIIKDNIIVGAIIVWINDEEINYLGNVFVDPAIHDKGIGSIAWNFIEETYPNTLIWRTETPGFSKRNHHFYMKKCGFELVDIKNPSNKYEESYILEKRMKK